MRVIYSRKAQKELLDIVRYCDESIPGLGEEFIEELDKLLEQCCEDPEIGAHLEEPYRILVMRRFPFNIIYRIGDKEIRVIAVAHQHRYPGYGLGRIEETKACYIREPQANWPVTASVCPDSRSRTAANASG